ncbi:MAG: hypothetical protein H0U59_07975 [Gemmatimonadaceae bacterium]|nr:hypothetical protein [Gemmatimonadaceae bacterium]
MQLDVKLATGGLSGGGAPPTVITFVIVPVFPPLSVTVRVTVRWRSCA